MAFAKSAKKLRRFNSFNCVIKYDSLFPCNFSTDNFITLTLSRQNNRVDESWALEHL